MVAAYLREKYPSPTTEAVIAMSEYVFANPNSLRWKSSCVIVYFQSVANSKGLLQCEIFFG